MAIKIRLVVILAIIFITNAGLNCNKIICDPESKYSFRLPVRVRPDSEFLELGDTLRLTLKESAKLKDLISGKLIDFSDAENLGLTVSFYEFINNDQPGALNKFKTTLFSGRKLQNTHDPSALQEYAFAEDSGNYKFNLDIEPLARGRYVIVISNAANVYRKNDNCTKAFFGIDYSETNQHIDLLNNWRPDIDLTNINKTKVYYFEVR